MGHLFFLWNNVIEIEKSMFTGISLHLAIGRRVEQNEKDYLNYGRMERNLLATYSLNMDGSILLVVE